MDIIKSIEESKKQTAILNNLVIDFEYLKNLTTQLLSDKIKKDDHFFEIATITTKLCDNIILDIKNLQDIIPKKHD